MFNVILRAVSVVQIAYALFYRRVVKISVVNTRAAQEQPARILSGGCTVWPKITGIVAYRLVAILICLVLPRNLYYVDHDSIFRFCIANAIAKYIL